LLTLKEKKEKKKEKKEKKKKKKEQRSPKETGLLSIKRQRHIEAHKRCA